MDLPTPSRQLWNLRRGDADDNRTSPHGRGWRNLAFASALESNYLTASLAVLAVIVVPALLVGLMPPVLVAYGRRNIAAVAMVASHPIAALLSIAALVGLAIGVGKPLLVRAVDNFWHLHYTLVFPVFVALRELICAAAERLPARAMSAEQLSRRRKLGTVLAALLLAGGGLSLALSLEFSADPALVERRGGVQARALAMVGLTNAAVVLGVSTVVASVYWFWHEITSSHPVLDWAPRPAVAAEPPVRVAHLSDLHVVGERYGYRMESGTDGPRGNGRIRRALHKLAAIHAATPLDRVLITGDITDAGTRAEWAEFIDLLRPFPGLRARMLFVPGNHDVNVVDRTNTGRLDVPWSMGQALRKLRVVLALDEIQGDCVHVVDRTSGAVGSSLRDYLWTGERPALLRALAERGAWRGRWEMDRVWEEMFPLVVPPGDHGSYGVILLDSNAQRHFSLTNAIGVVGRAQLRALRSVLRTCPDRAWLILLHHHIVEYPIRWIGLDERIGVALVNAPDVMKVIASHPSPVVVLHGHRHRDWIGSRADVVVCSAPSVALGSKSGDRSRGSFHVYELAPHAGGGLGLIASRHVTVA